VAVNVKPRPYWLFCGVLQPKVVSDTEEMELARHLERLEEQNREISGDEASDSSGGEDDGEGDGENDRSKTAALKEADDDIEIEDDDV